MSYKNIHPHNVPAEIQLPNELLEIIINELALDTEDSITRTALASCRLASHVLHSVATPLLFSSIELTQKNSDYVLITNEIAIFKERAIKLNQLLANRSIAASTHTLTLRCKNTFLEASTIGILIASIINRLPHIRNFIWDSDGTFLSFASITRNISSAIRTLCKSPNLTTLTLRGIQSFPISAITACPNLRCLRLSDTETDLNDVNSMDQTSSPQPSYLDSLEIDEYSISSLGKQPFAKYFSRIKHLQLKDISDADELELGWDIMLLASQSLTTLDLFWFHEPELVPSFRYDLGRLPALRHVKIQLSIDFAENIRMLSLLTQLLSISSSTSSIETLEIEFAWYDIDIDDLDDLFSSGAGWSTLDQILSSDKFVSLTKVVLRLEMLIADRSLEFRNLFLSFINVLFPMFKTLQRTLETSVEILYSD